MKAANFSAALGIALLVATGASAQERHDNQFNDHDRQVTHDWYTQHQKQAPAGFRSTDRLTPAQEEHLRPGQRFDGDLEKHSHTLPRDLGRRLPPPPKHHKYVAVGQRIALVDTVAHIVRDVIDINDPHHH